jgi:hypothetical protein
MNNNHSLNDIIKGMIIIHQPMNNNQANQMTPPLSSSTVIEGH